MKRNREKSDCIVGTTSPMETFSLLVTDSRIPDKGERNGKERKGKGRYDE
jgi:hypothetical protein